MKIDIGFGEQSRQSVNLFLQSWNWDSPNPSPAGESAHPPGSGGRGTLVREGLGESQFRRGDIHCGTVYIYVLCALEHKIKICEIILDGIFVILLYCTYFLI